MLTVAKFGGTSLADAAGFLRVRDIVRADPSRRVVVVSAPGKRHAADQKITDLLYVCHAHLQYGITCWELWRKITQRYLAIRDGCGLCTPVGEELQSLYAGFSNATPQAFLVSRGEYLSARLMADLLEYDFVDAAEWLMFDTAGHVLQEQSFAALRALAEGRRIVTPGFYGRLPEGSVHTFPRGGSDVTGSLAAAALDADVCENWTDVQGVFSADPTVVDAPAPIAHLSYEQLDILSQVGMQVLHEDAVAPLSQRGIPLHIRSTFAPQISGTWIDGKASDAAPSEASVFFAGRKRLSMLRVQSDAETVLPVLQQVGVRVFSHTFALGRLTVLAERSPAVYAAAERLGPLAVQILEQAAVVAALSGANSGCEGLPEAVQRAGICLQQAIFSPPCLLMVVQEQEFTAAMRAAYAACAQSL